MLATKQAMLTLVPTRSGKSLHENKKGGNRTGLKPHQAAPQERTWPPVKLSTPRTTATLALWRSSLGIKLLLRGKTALLRLHKVLNFLAFFWTPRRSLVTTSTALHQAKPGAVTPRCPWLA